ncbi:MAG: type III pantothenate kinase [Desulfobulbaceae bacterium]|nr:type III pantothenate kinase [Desulfobulbaceae bacterium]
MLLTIDVGNSHMVIGLYKEAILRYHWRVNTNRDSTGDELAALFHNLFTLEKLTFEHVHHIIIASVVPQMQSAWVHFSRRHLELDPVFANDAEIEIGMPILIDNPTELGADRIVNAVAAYDKHQSALIVIDFGTAITFDCISADGKYLGGAIAPGLAISLDALGQRTARLPRVDISTPPEKAIGTNTTAAIKSGILLGYGGMVEGMVARLKQEMSPAEVKTIATGGMAGLIAPHAPSIEGVEPMLTLEGLRLLHERHND